MNLLLTAPLWLILILFAALAAAAIEDGWRLRISNVTCVVVLLLAVVAAMLVGPSLALWQNVTVMAGLLVLGTVAFSMGALGGGDIKLLAALGLWVDLRGATWLLAAVFLAGGVLALMFIVGGIFFRKDVSGARRSRRIPYGIAIVGGTAVFCLAGRTGEFHPKPGLPSTVVQPAR